MEEIIRLKGRPIASGKIKAKALVSHDSFSWLGGVNPRTGEVVDSKHDCYGTNLAGTVFVYPRGKGSTTGAAVFLETVRRHVNPAALVNARMEAITSLGAMLAPLLYDVTIPAVDQFDADPTTVIRSGDIVDVDGFSGRVTVFRP